jgi:NADH-quinone oxidoreductase subunit I
MSIAPLLRKVFLLDLLKGLSITFKYQTPKETQTAQYPQERPQIADRFRGQPLMKLDPVTGDSLCIGCNLCALACPENLITMKSERDPVTKKKVMTTYVYDVSRCMFCGLCEEACPTESLKLGQGYEMALYSREGMVLDRQVLEHRTDPEPYDK